jgi:hypothetical protein
MALFITNAAASIKLKGSVFEREHHRIRYETAFQALGENSGFSADTDFSSFVTGSAESSELKSPGKAFFYSLAVPGLGQYYYGSKVKPVLFLSAEVASWIFYFKWHGQGDDLTVEYEEFNRLHWDQKWYEDQLRWTYDEEIRDAYGLDPTDDLDTIAIDDKDIDVQELAHDLPDTRSQQYYEMTGKYDQFAWGWDDAERNDSTLYDYDSSNSPGPCINDGVPSSENRDTYEGMRDDANNRYDRATRMLFVSIANRLISAFEAYFVTKSRNNKIKRDTWDLTRLKVRTRLKSYHSYGDTPFVTFAYRF